MSRSLFVDLIVVLRSGNLMPTPAVPTGEHGRCWWRGSTPEQPGEPAWPPFAFLSFGPIPSRSPQLVRAATTERGRKLAGLVCSENRYAAWLRDPQGSRARISLVCATERATTLRSLSASMSACSASWTPWRVRSRGFRPTAGEAGLGSTPAECSYAAGASVATSPARKM